MSARIPTEAIDAAAESLSQWLETLPFPREAAMRALSAAAPAIRAAERERIRQLAIDHSAICTCEGNCGLGSRHSLLFASLIEVTP